MKKHHTGTLKTGWLCAAVLLIAALLVCLAGGAAVAEDTPFTYTVTDGRAVITGINAGFSGALTIPESVDGYPVTEIADGAFSGCTAITSVSLPSSVTVIGNSAFYGCTGLTQADIPAGVLDIGENAFEGCSNMAAVTLSDDITVMKKGVFKNCTSLKTMTPVKRVKVTGVTLDETLTVSHKETAALTAEVAPSNASNKALIWSSSDETVATVVNGNVTGVYPGEAVITCAAADNKQITSSCTVTVTPVAPEEITSEDITVKMNDYAVPNLYFTPEYAMATLTFESADPEVATVDAESGLITGIFVGQTTITVTADNGVTCTVNVTVECSGHEPVTDEAVEPKCEEPGKTEGSHCSVCGGILEAQEEIPATGHTEVIDEAVAPKCEETGLTEGSHCSVCNKVLVAQEEIEATGHTEVIDEAVAPKCEETGLTEGKHCSVCEKVLVAQEVIEATGHTEVIDEAVAPKCEETGLTEGKHCSVCEKVLVAQEVIEATGHTEVIDEAVAPKCEEAGLTEGKHCSVCDKVLVAQEVIEATGHTEVIDEAVAPKCEETGLTEGKHCSVCDKVLVAREEIPATGHTPETLPAVPHTCTEDGLTEGSYCSVCEKTLVAQEVDPAAHTPEAIPAVPHTCTEDGLTEGSRCSVCEAILVAQEVDPAAHTPVTDEAVEPKCEEPGLTEGSHCSVCGETLTAQEEIAPTGHTPVTDEGVEPKCEEPGLTEGSHCSVCEKVLTAQEEIAPTGHTPEVIPAVKPTQSEDGLTEGSRCSVCEKILVEQQVVKLYETAKVNNDVKLTAYNGEEETVNVPSKINGETITVIAENAFAGNETVKTVKVPKTVEEIEKNAFTGCDALTKITIPDSVTVIGSNAVPAGTTVYCGRESYAAKWAAANGLNVSYIGPAIETQPADQTAAEGETAVFTVAAGGSSLTYRWQENSGEGWQNTTADGNTGAELTVTAAIADNGKQYRCVITDGDGIIATSDAAVLTVTSKLAITTQPESVTAEDGTEVKLHVEAEGDGLTYQWQYRKSTTGSWANSPATGSTTDTLTVPATTSRNGYQYRCVITDKNGNSVTSDAATLTVQIALKITTQPASVSAVDGTDVKFTVKAEGDGLTYQWKYRKTSTGTWANSPATGNQTATVTIAAALSKNGYQYECVIKDKYGKSVTSSVATLTVQTPLKITTQPANVTAADGENATFTVKATGDGLTYQWKYRKTSTGSWANSPATGNQTATVTIAAALSKNGYQYECVIKDKYGKSVTSSVATLTVQTPLKITTQPANVTAADGENATFTVKATGDGLTYQWKYRKSSTGSWANSPATGNQTATVTIAAALSKNGYQYECVIKDKYGKSVTSSVATLTVQTPLKITAQPANATVTAGADATFTVKATGDGLTYQWKYRTSSTGTWANTTATGYNTATLTVPGTASRNGYQYECVIKDKYGKSVTSSAATLTVNQEIVLKITAQPQNKTVTAGTEAKFTVKVTGEGLKYQWQYRKTADGTWANTTATGYNTATLTVPGTASRNGYQYRCVITDKNGKKVTSKAVTLTVQ